MAQNLYDFLVCLHRWVTLKIEVKELLFVNSTIAVYILRVLAGVYYFFVIIYIYVYLWNDCYVFGILVNPMLNSK